MVDFYQVGDMDEPGSLEQRSSNRVFDAAIPLSYPCREGIRKPTGRHGMEGLAVVQLQCALGDRAQRVGLLQYRIENRGEIAGRRIDDLQSLGGRGLLLQGFARLSQESRILHR